MKVVIGQSELNKGIEELTYQSPFPITKRCRSCKSDMALLMLVNDENGELVKHRPEMYAGSRVAVWPHDASTIVIYLCVNCGRLRATWNQG